MKLGDTQTREVVALREKLQERLEQLGEELEMTRLNISVLDTLLKQSSFVKASDYAPDPEQTGPAKSDTPPPRDVPGPPPKVITAGSGDAVANIYTYPDKISIILEDSVRVTESTPPFQQFFVSRIMGEMQKKDEQMVDSGDLPEDSAIQYSIKNQDGCIREITITNYRLEERARNIANTAKWVLSRMLEHGS